MIRSRVNADTKIDAQERSTQFGNQRVLGFHPVPTSIEEVGASHRGMSSSGGLRAAVFGVNDGLVSIACLVLGVAGAASTNSTILLTGIAGLLAGAFSMAAGEYISMRSQREMFEYQIGLERAELAQYPEEEAEELTLIYIARGMPESEAKALGLRMIADPEVGLDTLRARSLASIQMNWAHPGWRHPRHFLLLLRVAQSPYCLIYSQFSSRPCKFL